MSNYKIDELLNTGSAPAASKAAPLEVILPEPDDAYRDKMRGSAEPEAKQWVEKDKEVLSLDRRLQQYDEELRRRESGSGLAKREAEYEEQLVLREMFMKDHDKPLLIGRGEWKKQMDVYDNNVSEAHKALLEYSDKCTSQEIAVLQELREAKYQQLIEATNERRQLGKLPSEESEINKATSERSQQMGLSDDSFDILANLKKKRAGDFSEGIDENGDQMSAMVWAARTLAGDDPELKELAEVQRNLQRELGRMPKEREVDQALMATRNPVHSIAESESETLVRKRVQ